MRRRYYDWGDILMQSFITILIIICVGFLGLAAYSIYGRVTQQAVITVMVIDKEIDSGINCVSTGKSTICTPYTYHIIYTDDDEYHIEPELYDSVAVNKTHVFHVKGWDWDRYIDEVLE